MRLSWWLGRARRLGPALICCCVLWYLIHHYSSESKSRWEAPKPNPSRPVPPPEPTLNRWVITEKGHATRDVCSKALMFFSDWTILIIGPRPNYTSHSKCVYFSQTEADRVQVSISQHIEHPHLLAYIYAIQHEAEAIYIVPQQGFPDSQDQPHIFPLSHYAGLMASHNRTFSPLAHFGCNNVPKKVQDQKYTQYKHCAHNTPAIQAPIVLTAEQAGKPSCDPRAPPITVQEGIMVEGFHFDGALYMKPAFWLLPVVQAASDIAHVEVWQVIIQKLLWLGGHTMMLWHNQYNTDVSSLHKRTKFVLDKRKSSDLLSSWKCSKEEGVDIHFCVNDILDVVQNNGLVNDQSVIVMKDWLNALQEIKYNIPKVNPPQTPTCISKLVNFQPVDYNAAVFKRTFSERLYVPVTNKENLTYIANRTCSKYTMPHDVKINFTQPWDQFDNVLLIVTFNNPHYEAIPFLEVLYRAFFPYILYCGPGSPNIKNAPLLRNYTFSFISYGSTPEGHFPGSFNYECVTLGIEMKYPVDGYMVIADDILLATYKLMDLRRHLVWFLPQKETHIGEVVKLRECRLGMCDFYPHWRWWEDYQSQIISMLKKLQNNQHKSHLMYRCYQQIVDQTGGEMRAYGAYSDAYYVPQRLAQDFAALAAQFRKQDVFLEIAVPTILKCLENTEDIQSISGLSIWDESRDWPWLYFKPREMRPKSFMHPTKWGYLARGSPDYGKFFCTQVLPFLHDPYGRIR